MLLLAADENLHAGIISGLRLRLPSVDIMSVQEAGLAGSPDAVVLAWAAGERRVLVTDDRATMPAEAYSRVEAGLDMPGVVITPVNHPTRRLIELLIAVAVRASPTSSSTRSGTCPSNDSRSPDRCL